MPGGVNGSLIPLGELELESSVRASLPLMYPDVMREDGELADEVAGCELKREWANGRGCINVDTSDDGAEARWWAGA